eukprot:gene5638-9454_t
MNSLVGLDSNHQNYSLEVTSYQDINGNLVELSNPVNFFAKIIPAKMRIPLKFQKRFYNKYEHFEATDSCVSDYKIGGCYNSTTNPPTDGAENFVLCCLETKRGTGQHCLRYDYNSCYEAYEMEPFDIHHEIHVNISSNGRSEFFHLTNNRPKKTIKNFGTVQMSIKYQIERPHDLKFNYVLFKEEKTENWFFINKYHVDFSKLTKTALEFKAFSKCSDKIHSETKTHHDPFHILDQFFPFKNNSISELFQPFGRCIRILKLDNYFIEMNVEPDFIFLDTHLDNIK